MIDLRGLPGADRVLRGLADLEQGRRTPEALWLTAASSRLRAAGIPMPDPTRLETEPELQLYEALRAHSDDAYYRYNAMRHELNSFLLALEREQRPGC